MDIKTFLDEQQENYVNNSDKTILEDGEFDALVEAYEILNETSVNYIGAKPTGESIKLDFPCPSLNKCKGITSKKDLQKFMVKNPGPYVKSDKVDGTSLQLKYSDGKLTIFTTGDGVFGNDISFLQNYISFPELNEYYVIRGELSIYNNIFTDEVAPILQNRGLKGTNSRNFVNGLVNSKHSDVSLASKCVFFAFEVQSENWHIDRQYEFLEENGFNVPNPQIIDVIDDFHTFLENELTERREHVNYRIDGIIITDISNSCQTLENSNPDFSIAFKIDTFAVGKVKNITWNGPSKDGYLTPIVHIDPLNIIGTKMKEATAHNAKFLIEKEIGIGSIITVTFGGDVIPKVVSVISKGVPLRQIIPFYWDKNHTDIIAKNYEQYPASHIAKIEYFITTMKIKRVGYKTLCKFYEMGIDTISKLIYADKEKIMSIERMGEKSSTFLIDEIRRNIEKASWGTIMAASGLFGELIGDTIMNEFISKFPMWEIQDITKDEILKIHGFGEFRAQNISEGLPKFKQWISENPMIRPQKRENTDQTLAGQIIVFTGFEGSEIKMYLQNKGAVVKDNWVVGATILLAKNVNSTSAKSKNAKNKGIPIVPMTEYENLQNYIK